MPTYPVEGNPMVAAGKKNEPAKTATEGLEEKLEDRSKKKPSPFPMGDDYEDGDIATPKRDRYGSDDEPL
jgi:hypothetical protein